MSYIYYLQQSPAAATARDRSRSPRSNDDATASSRHNAMGSRSNYTTMASSRQQDPLLLSTTVTEHQQIQLDRPLQLTSPVTHSLPPVPRTGHISDALRQKVITGELTNLALLHPQSPAERAKTNKLTFDMTDGSLTLTNTEKSPKDLSFSQWLECYLVFMALRVEAYPSESLGLIAHLQQVQRFINQGRDGVEYDLQFRLAKKQFPSIPWGQYIPEIADCIRRPSPRTPALPTSNPWPTPSYKEAQMPRSWLGFCYNFNKQEGCARRGCVFRHACAKCAGRHPAFECQKQ